MDRTVLNTEALNTALEALNAVTAVPWRLQEAKLHKQFEFDGFIGAFGFMTRAAMVAERMNHHPEWCNVYSTVIVDLSTHDAGGITALDFELATRMEALLE